MNALVPCGGCARHVRSDEPVCPFCGAEIVDRAPLAAKRRPGRRIVRAAVMVASAITPIGCSDDAGPPDQGFLAQDAYGLAADVTIPPDATLDSGFIPGDAYGLADVPEPDGGSDSDDAE